MTPTAKFRWLKLKADEVVPHPSAITLFGDARVLQQWWAIERNGQITPTGEWRDIPVEEQA